MKKTLLLIIASIIYSTSYAAVYPMPIIMGRSGGRLGINDGIALWITFNLFTLIGMCIYYFFYRDKEDGFFKLDYGDINIGTATLLLVNGVALFIVVSKYIASLL
jgi:hypothetical protein